MKRFVVLAVLVACANPGDDVPGVMFDAPVARAAPVEVSPPTTATATATAAQIWELHDRLVGCVMSPTSCEVNQITAPGSSARRDLDSFIQRRRLDGLEARPVSLPPIRHVVRTWPTTNSTQVELCWVDDLVLVTPAPAHGQPIIVDDAALTLGETWIMTVVHDVWRLEERRITRTERGQASWCR